MEPHEKSIIFKLKNGDNAGYKYIYDHYYPLLCSIACRFLNDRDEAEYIVDGLVIDLYEKRERLAIDTSLRNYLIRSVRNRCTNYMSSRQRRRFDNMASIDSACRDVLSSAAHIQPPEIRLIEKELETIVSEAIENLPEECRKVFKASRFSHMTYNEIAEDFGISVNTVKYHMKQALAILSRKLEKYLIFIFLLMRLHS